MPETCAPNRENHIREACAVVTHVEYGKGRIAYVTANAPENGLDVLRLAFEPLQVTADGTPLPRRDILSENAYAAKALGNGD